MGDLKRLNEMCKAAELGGLGTKLNAMLTQINKQNQDGVLPTPAGLGVTLAVDANAEDFQTTTTVVIRQNGILNDLPAVAAFDISASGTCAGDTIAQAKSGIGWVYADITDDSLDIETDKAAQAYDSVIEAHAAFVTASNTLPPADNDVCIGAVQVTEGNSGAFTWGTGSISDETEAFISFEGRPEIISAMASFALEAATPKDYMYGAAKIRLGDGTIITATGEADSVILAGTVAHTFVGAWIFYILADDTAFAQPLALTYKSLAEARAAVLAASKNPHMPEMGAIYVDNTSAANFVGGTTALNAAGITTTFDINAASAESISLYT